jgi:hypothetical protein
MKSVTGRWWPIAVSLCWLLTVGAGIGVLLNYSNTAGQDGMAPVRWPAQSKIPHVAGEPALVMFVHPRCPCTKASMGELAELMAHCQGLVGAYVVFFHPGNSGEEWSHSDLWRAAEAIPGVRVQSDEDGREARLFHGETSGHTMLYDGQGRLLFDGGITASRGHSGDNDGRDAIEALLHGKTAQQAMTPVFGCPIFERGSKPTGGTSS